MAKVMTTPIMALLQFTFYGKRFTRGILATLGLVCVGVCLATATEFTLTLVGFSIAFAACFVTAIYSIVRKESLMNRVSVSFIFSGSKLNNKD